MRAAVVKSRSMTMSLRVYQPRSGLSKAVASVGYVWVTTCGAMTSTSRGDVVASVTTSASRVDVFASVATSASRVGVLPSADMTSDTASGSGGRDESTSFM